MFVILKKMIKHAQPINSMRITKVFNWLLILSITLMTFVTPVLANQPDPDEQFLSGEASFTLQPAPIQQTQIDNAIPADLVFDEGDFILYLPVLFGQADNTGPFLDLNNRQSVDDYFTANYLLAPQPAIGWTGSLNNCTPGTLSVDHQAAVLQRINFYRRMAGVPDTVILNESYNQKAQAAALIMAKNGQLDHTPPSNWLCYSALGYAGASSSNLALGAYGWVAINMYMLDPGTGNGAAGHRRWILYPQTQEMGNGDIPPQPNYYSANALVVFDDHWLDPRPDTREEFVAWPPPGYVPYQIVFPRWSFSYANADFSAAIVYMTQNGSNVPLVKEAIENGYGENTLVWIPNGLDNWASWPKPTQDTRYTVTIQNVKILNVPHNFSYDVIVFDPQS